jgi:uncharacterized membrane protein
MQAKTVDVGRSLTWFACGWRIFATSPGLWILFALVLALFWFLFALVPLIGPLAVALLTPVLGGGLLHAAREAQAGRPLEFGHLFLGFRESGRLNGLLALGGVSLAGAVLSGLVLFAFMGGSMMAAMHSGGLSPERLVWAGTGMGLGMLIVLLIELAVAMALVYAVPLVMFRALAPGEAMRSSFEACLRNFLALTVFGVIYFFLALLASLPLMLGWLVLLPVSVGMLYCSYLDLYEGG